MHQLANKSEFDSATNIIKERLSLANTEILKRSKGTDPYRKEPISAREAIYNFSQIPPEIWQQMRLQLGDEAVDKHFAEIAKMQRRLKNA